MKKQLMIIAIVVSLITGLGLTACGDRSPEGRIERIKGKITERLALDAAQQAHLDEIAAGLKERGREMRRERGEVHEILTAELAKEQIDRSTIDALVNQRRDRMDEMVDYLIDSLVEFHATLTAQQRETLVAELDKIRERHESRKSKNDNRYR